MNIFSKLLIIIGILFFNVTAYKGQSTNCSTATQLSVTATTTVCVSGTNASATLDNTLYGSCNAAAVHTVWYTYVATGSNNGYTVTPGTMTNPEIIIYTGGCPGTGALQTCTTSVGAASAISSWGMVAGTQVWVGVASNGGTNGTFQLCVKSTTPAVGVGNTCAQSVPICSMASFTRTSVPSNSSGIMPACFGSAPQQDVWLKFTVYQTGLLGWKALPNNASSFFPTEFDWALWDITTGCPVSGATPLCCNYNYAFGSANGFGMQNQSGTITCGATGSGSLGNEFCSMMSVTCGKTYAIQVSNYDNDNVGFSFAFTGSTCLIGTTASFVNTPTLVCGSSLTTTITNSSTGTCQQVWSFGDGSANYTGGSPPPHTYTTPGTYAITAQSQGACTSVATKFVKLLAPLTATTTPANIKCAAACTGSAVVSNIAGGDGIYTYSWSPGGATTNSVTGLCAGTYSVTMANATCSTSITNSITITAPPALSVTATGFNPGCGVSNGGITASSLGGTPGYSFAINAGAFSSASTFTNLAAGTYTIFSKDLNGCTTNTPVTLTMPAQPTVMVNSASVCAGQSATLTAAGGTSYTWSPSTGLSTTTGSVVIANPAASTVYSVIGANGSCTAAATSSVTIITSPTLSVTGGSICPGNSLTLTATGATNYTWSPAGSLSASSGSVVVANPANTTVYNVTGASGSCTSSVNSTVTVISNPTVSVNSGSICSGSSLTLTATGATNYTWSPAVSLSASSGSVVVANPSNTTVYTITGASGSCTSSVNSTVTVISNPTVSVNSGSICSGSSLTLTATGAANYTWSPTTGLSSSTGSTVIASPTVTTNYTVTGAVSSCTNTAVATVNITSPPSLTVSPQASAICAGGTTTLSASGSSSYTWAPSSGLSTTTGSVVTASPVSTTVYTVTGGVSTCTASGQATVTVNPNPTLTVTPSNTTICSGSSSTLSVAGATSYTWSPSATLSSSSAAAVTASPMVTTTYNVIGVTGVCSNTASATVNVITASSLTVSPQTSTICAGSSILLTVGGSTSYTWSPVASLNTATGSTVTASPAATTIYTINAGVSTCTAVIQCTVTVNPIPTLTLTPVSASICAGNSTPLSVSGASSYTWSPSSTLNTANSSTVTATPLNSTTYTVTGIVGICTSTSAAVVNVVANPTIAVVPNTTICAGTSNVITASGASSYSWSPATGLNTTTGNAVTASPTLTTTYVITGSINTCTGTASTTVTVIPQPTLTVSPNATVCSGTPASIFASGAATYNWSPSTGLASPTSGTTSASPSATTNYTVTGTNSGCSATGTVAVYVTVTPTINVNPGSVSICSGAHTSLSASGATSYTWSPAGALTATNTVNTTASPVQTTTYTVIGANGSCTASNTVEVTVIPVPVILVPLASPVCLGQNTLLQASGGNTYQWSPSSGIDNPASSSTLVTPLVTTVYTVTVSNGGLCSASATVQVVVNPLPHVNAGRDTVVNIDEYLTLIGTGDVEVGFLAPTPTPLNCNFCNTIIVNPQERTCYILKGENGYGCLATDEVCVDVTKEYDIFIPNAFTPNDDSDNDVFIPVGYGLSEIKLSIFDRWGAQLFNGTNIGWDGTYKGKLCEQNVYTYKAVIKTLAGNTVERVGHVTLLPSK